MNDATAISTSKVSTPQEDSEVQKIREMVYSAVRRGGRMIPPLSGSSHLIYVYRGTEYFERMMKLYKTRFRKGFNTERVIGFVFSDDDGDGDVIVMTDNRGGTTWHWIHDCLEAEELDL